MVHIKLTVNPENNYAEQLYYTHNDKAIAAMSIDLDRTNHTITIYKYSLKDKVNGEPWKTFNTSEIGCCNPYNTVDEPNVENWDFDDEF